MREILGYVPIEPDGSVRVTVPANVAFQISVVDANARQIFPLHAAWLQLLPGEVLSCNGCHLPPAQQTPVPGGSFYSHGRPGTFASAWSGSTGTGLFPGTQGSYVTCPGETMAEALVGWNCGTMATAAATPSVNVVFNDPWFGGGVGNEPVLLSYDDPTFTTPLPTSQACALPGGWTSNCRIIINYPINIQPLWDKLRGANTCVNCHTASTAATGYLDLADGASATNANQDNAYQQLTQNFSVTTTNPTTGATTQPWSAARSSFPATRLTHISFRFRHRRHAYRPALSRRDAAAVRMGRHWRPVLQQSVPRSDELSSASCSRSGRCRWR